MSQMKLTERERERELKFREVRFQIDEPTYQKLAAAARAKKMSLRKTFLPGVLSWYVHALESS